MFEDKKKFKRIKKIHKRLIKEDVFCTNQLYHSDFIDSLDYDMDVRLQGSKYIYKLLSCQDDPEGFGSNNIELQLIGISKEGEKVFFKDITLKEFLIDLDKEYLIKFIK